jgi:hypothetical protein
MLFAADALATRRTVDALDHYRAGDIVSAITWGG